MSEDPRFEKALLTQIIQEKAIRRVIKKKITAEFFFDAQSRAQFTYLFNWYKNPNYGDTPSWDSFLHTFPSFERVDLDDSVEAVCDKVREQKVYSDIADEINDIANRTSGDPLDGLETFRKAAARLTAAHVVNDSCDVRSRVDEVLESYKAMKAMPEGQKLKGRAWPWAALNDATLGAQDGQMFVFYGRPKSKKTWVALKAMHCFHEHGAIPIIFSQELTDLEIAERWICIDAGVDYGKFRRGELPPRAEREMYRRIEQFAEKPPVIVSMLTGVGEEACLEMAAAVDEYGANAVLIDAANCLGNDVKEIVAMTRGFKRVCKIKKIIGCMTTQRLRPKGKARSEDNSGNDVYGSDSYLQDCDGLFAVESDIEMRRAHEVHLTTVALRSGKPTKFSINARLCTSFEQKMVLPFDDTDGEEQLQELDGQEDTMTDETEERLTQEEFAPESAVDYFQKSWDFQPEEEVKEPKKTRKFSFKKK